MALYNSNQVMYSMFQVSVDRERMPGLRITA